MEHHQAVALAALGGGAQLAELVCLGRLGHLGVAEGPRGAGHLRAQVVQTWTGKTTGQRWWRKELASAASQR